MYPLYVSDAIDGRHSPSKSGRKTPVSGRKTPGLTGGRKAPGSLESDARPPSRPKSSTSLIWQTSMNEKQNVDYGKCIEYKLCKLFQTRILALLFLPNIICNSHLYIFLINRFNRPDFFLGPR